MVVPLAWYACYDSEICLVIIIKQWIDIEKYSPPGSVTLQLYYNNIHILSFLSVYLEVNINDCLNSLNTIIFLQ